MDRFVLIVDDKPSFLSTFEEQWVKWFQKWDLKVKVAPTENKARTFLKRNGDTVELVIVDICLPTTTRGRALLSHIKEHYPSVKRIAITAEAERGEVGAMVALQLFHGYIDKDWRNSEIRKEIKRVLSESCDPAAHSSIVAALERWLEQDPAVKKRTLRYMGGEEKTVAQLLEEIRNGTPLGKIQERAIFRMACDLFLHRPSVKAK